MTRLFTCAAIVIFALPSVLLAQGSLEDLTKPIEGRSMRASSSFRATPSDKTATKDGKTRLVYDPKADFYSVPGDEPAIPTTSRFQRARRKFCWMPRGRE